MTSAPTETVPATRSCSTGWRRHSCEIGWRLKPLHRMIVLSNTYRQSGRSPIAADAQRIDPENRLLWHFSRRRLTAEEIRDAMLAVSGRLNLKAAGRASWCRSIPSS